MPGLVYVEEVGLAAILATKRLAGVTREANLRECVTCTHAPSANKAAHSVFETQKRCHQKFKIGVSVAHKNYLCPPKNIQKKKYNNF